MKEPKEGEIVTCYFCKTKYPYGEAGSGTCGAHNIKGEQHMCKKCMSDFKKGKMPQGYKF